MHRRHRARAPPTPSSELRQADLSPTSCWPTTTSTAAPALEAIAALRTATGLQAPAIVITADHSAALQREVRQRGIALLRKPLKAAALRALMYQLTWQRAAVAAE